MRASPGLGTYTDHESDVCRAAERLREAEDHAPAVGVTPERAPVVRALRITFWIDDSGSCGTK
jgi:hypothetical protein